MQNLPMEPLVSVIYVNYRTAELTARSVASVVQRCVGCSYEILVVDNFSGDDIGDCLSAFDGVRLIHSGENLGFGRANNLGLSEAQGRYILFLNTDTELINDALWAMAEYLEEHDDVGAVGANLYTGDCMPNQSFLYCHTLGSEIRGFMPEVLKKNARKVDKWFNSSGAALDVDGYISGAAVMLRREWLKTHGGFNPAFFMYYEDMELSVRVRRSGLRLVNVPWAKIVHLGGGSSGTPNNDDAARRYAMLSEAKYTYYRIVYSRRYSLTVYWVNRFFHGFYSLFGSRKNRVLHKMLNEKLKCLNV